MTWANPPLRFCWYAESLLGTELFLAESPREMLINGLSALSELLRSVGGRPEGVALAVLVGDTRKPEYHWITGLQSGAFEDLADWFDHECERLFDEARTHAADRRKAGPPGRPR